jgi:hypothetical protein
MGRSWTILAPNRIGGNWPKDDKVRARGLNATRPRI